MKELFIISSGSNIAKSKPTISSSKDIVSSDKASSPKDFLTIMFAQIKESLSLKDTNTKIDYKLDANPSEKKSLDNKDEKKSLDEHLLSDLLEIVSVLKGSSEKKPSFPALSKSLEKLINNDVAIKELKNVSNLSDLMKLSKKFNLGLEKLSIKKLDLISFKKEFPHLDKKSFFEIPKEVKKSLPKNIEIQSTKISFKDIQKPTQKTKIKPSILEQAINSSKPKEKIENTKETIVKVLNDVKKDIKVVDNAKKDIKITQENTLIINKEVKKTAHTDSKTVIKSALLKDEKELQKNIKIPTKEKDTKASVTTRTNEPKIGHKSLIENVLQNIKTTKSNQNTKIDLQNTQQIIEKNMNDESKIKEHTDTKVDTSSKIEFKTLAKTEIISNKQTNATKETFSNFANELREKIDNYKPPIMKIQLALNPKALGEVDVTILNRGNSLHVNITSNTSSMSLFTQNQAEFKNSLVNMGFTNLEMNFSDQGKQNNQQNSNNKSSSKEFTDEQENQNIENEESSVELIIPQYI